MTTVSIGDLARNFQLRRQNAELQTRLSTLTKEMTTGRKSDVADAVLWLCSDRASFVVGQSISVDGGFTMR